MCVYVCAGMCAGVNCMLVCVNVCANVCVCVAYLLAGDDLGNAGSTVHVGTVRDDGQTHRVQTHGTLLVRAAGQNQSQPLDQTLSQLCRGPSRAWGQERRRGGDERRRRGGGEERGEEKRRRRREEERGREGVK